MSISAQRRPVVALLGGDGMSRAFVRAATLLEGWAVHTRSWPPSMRDASDWTTIDLVVLICDQERKSVGALDTLRRSGYDGPFVLLATELTPTLRKRAFLQGALDVVQLPAAPHVLTARVTTVLRSRLSAVSPPAPDAP